MSSDIFGQLELAVLQYSANVDFRGQIVKINCLKVSVFNTLINELVRFRF